MKHRCKDRQYNPKLFSDTGSKFTIIIPDQYHQKKHGFHAELTKKKKLHAS